MNISFIVLGFLLVFLPNKDLISGFSIEKVVKANCNDGSCVNGMCDTNGTCVCQFGYDGSTCSNYLGCNAGGCNSCYNGGVCQPNGLCQCGIGYNGLQCSNFIGCNAGGVLSCGSYGYCLSNGHCQCYNGFTGVTCNVGCTLGAFSCQNGGTCMANGLCHCPIGYTGINCATFIGCRYGLSLACQNGGTCLSTGYCQCRIGYNGQTCSNFVGCNAGGSLSCVNGGTCASNGYCNCLNGYGGNVCAYGCSLQGAFGCQNGGTCLGNGLCSCPVGFVGYTCATFSGCRENCLQCLNGGTCLATGYCKCKYGYSGDRCSNYNGIGCLSGGTFKCLNNGTCNSFGNCECAAGFTGLTCSTSQSQLTSLTLLNTVILTETELSALYSVIGLKNVTLLYRGTEHTFNSSVFHSKCDFKPKTVTLILSNLNYVFGGYTEATWDGTAVHKNDSNAYIFSLRRDGTSILNKFNTLSSENSIYTQKEYGPTFGAGYDIFISDQANNFNSSYTNFCTSYECPFDLIGNETEPTPAQTYLAGAYEFSVQEIEVFQIL